MIEGIAIVIAPVNWIDEFLDDAQVRHCGTVFEIAAGADGPERQLAPFAKLAGYDPARFTAELGLDEHVDQIRNEVFGAARAQHSPR